MHIHRLEQLWIAAGVAMLAIFLGLITVSAIADGMNPPSHVQTIDPTKVAQTPPFDKPGLHQIGPHEYEAYYIAQIFAFQPRTLEIPAGSTVTFYVTSPDVVHGFSVPETGVNTMVIPGWVSTVTQTFQKPGNYILVCNEYCGSGHQLMAGQIEVK
jgi:cytochrome c oxidase subunit 2